jgi:WhiB family redox-sensing transcriptional regulator
MRSTFPGCRRNSGRGACGRPAGKPTRDLFFSPDGERGSAKRRRERAAKAICASCPVREDCASYAIGNHERYGVWGGLSEHERELIWRDLSPVRPRPADVAGRAS